jgi:hypothetical protein
MIPVNGLTLTEMWGFFIAKNVACSIENWRGPATDFAWRFITH